MLLEKLADCKDKAAIFAEQVKYAEDEALKKLLDERAFIYPDQIIAAQQFRYTLTEARQ